jgi:phenylacetate-CoA ligase
MQVAQPRAPSRSHGDEARLHAAIERARRSPFYARHLAGCEVRSRDDLSRLPLTLRQHLLDASPFGMLVVPPAKAWHYHETSGTSGRPISTWCGLNELRQMAAVVHGMVPELAEDTVLLNRFPLFAPVSFVFEEALRLAGACHIAAGNMSWDVPFQRVLDFIQRLNVTALACLPLEPILLRELAREQGTDIGRELGSLKVIFAGGAALPPALRRILRSDWGARVVEIYGSNETMLLGVSCVQGRLHLCSQLLEIEVVDPASHQPVAPGARGVLTVTSLVHEVMPLVRYLTGDLVALSEEPCPCGQPGPTAVVLGRIDDMVAMGQTAISTHDILDAVYEFADALGTRTFFVVVRHRDLHVLIEVGDPASARHPERERALANRLGLPVTVEYLRHNDVMDRSALFRGPKIYKPSQISDWRHDGRKCITIMEALLEWPRFDLRTLVQLGAREVRNRRRRTRLLREDQATPR